MKIIAFLSQKGGSGKTTLAVYSAVAAQEAGHRVVVIDTDPQRSATVWGDAREAPSPIIAAAAPSELQQVLGAAKNEGMNVAIIDTAPHAAPEATRIARASDLVMIPCRPTACPFRAPEIAESRTALMGYGIPIAPPEITDRRAFSRAVATGRAVTEIEADGKAAEKSARYGCG